MEQAYAKKEIGLSREKKSVRLFFLTPLLLSSLLPILLLVFWQLLSQTGFFPPNLLPSPLAILDKILQLSAEGTLWNHIGITLYRVFAGFLFGTLFAVILGSIVGFYKPMEHLFDPIIQAFRSIPSLAWVPLFILWMGIGESSKVALIAVGVFFPVYLNIVSGISNVDRKLIEVGRMYQFTAYQIIKRIILPASLPSFLVGLRSGLGLGWMFVVAAELMGASKGLGFLLVDGQNTYSPDTILASILLFAILGKLSDSLLKGIEKRALYWQDSFVNQR